MKKFCFWGLVVMIVLSVTTFAMGQEKGKGKPGGFAADMVTIKATIKKVDQENRIVTIQGPRGNIVDAKVDKNAKNFDQIKEGDQVVARYIESIAVFVDKAETKPTATETTTVEVAPRGYKPGRVVVDTVEVTAKVLIVDYKKRTLKLELPEGNNVTVKVDKEVKKFKQIKKGDEVVVRYTKAFALTIEKP
ncbi:MAG: hypothetical protein ABFD82_23830 [Syntrophaceae bacterium]